MPTTTTFWDIRDNYITKIKAIVPAYLSNVTFDQPIQQMELRDFAPIAGSAGIRKFEFDRSGDATEPPYMDWPVMERNEGMRLTVAYPTHYAFYGRTDLNEIDKIVRSDAHQLRDVLFSAGNYLPGQSLCEVKAIREVDKSDPNCWFQVLELALVFTESQSLT